MANSRDSERFFQTCPVGVLDMSELLTVFLDSPGKLEPLSPSRLNREIQMPLGDRLGQLCRPTRKYRLYDEKCGLSKTPDVVVFQNFEPCQEYKTTVTIQNMQKVSKYAKIESTPSPFFRLSRLGENGVKIAPGMIVTINLTFAPKTHRDYFYEIVVVTADGNTTIPVYALGPRPILNIPDAITLPPTAVRVPSSQSIVIQNIGRIPTSYTVICSEPFQATPSRSSLSPDEFNEIKVTCVPKETQRSLLGEVCFHYASLKSVVKVECEVTDANVSLDHSDVLFGEVYMGLMDHKSFELVNRGNYALSFSWKRYESSQVDEAEKSKVISATKKFVEVEKQMCTSLEYQEVVDCQEHSMILDRQLKEDVKHLEKEEFSYSSKYFSILPMEGEVLPKQKYTFTVIFSPTEAESYTSFAYLDVTGKMERLPVSFTGHGKGPKVVFNTSVLNLNDLFLMANHEYEILVKNVGEIPATVVFAEAPLDFGGVLNCFPTTQYLRFNGTCKSFTLQFRTEHKGYFIEKVQFVIQESMETISFLMTGNVQCPHLQADVDRIDFGEVSYGKQMVKIFNLINPFTSPIDFCFKIDDSVVYCEFEPNSGIVEPLSEKPITMFIKALEKTSPEISLAVYSWAEKELSVEIPISYQFIHADIVCEHEDIYMNFGFVNFQYTRSCKFRNKSSVQCDLSHVPQKLPPGFHCTLDVSEFHMPPFGEVEVHLAIYSEVVGTFFYNLDFFINGCNKKTLCKVTCHMNGPVITIDPMELHFGNVNLLNNVTQSLRVTNDSPITASVELELVAKSCLKVDANRFELPPDTERMIQFKMFLTQNGPIKETVNINVKDGEALKLCVAAHGVGLPVRIDPKLDPEYDAGMQLTYKDFRLPVTFTNLGKKPYKICISRSLGTGKYQNPPRPSVALTFETRPSQFELHHNQALTLEIVAMVKKPRYISEEFYCFIGHLKSTKMDLMTSFVVKANFVEPAVAFSATRLRFQIGYRPEEEEAESTDSMTLIAMTASVSDISKASGVKEAVDEEEDDMYVSTEHQDAKSVWLRNALDIKMVLTLTTTKGFYIMSGDKLETTVNVTIERNSKINVRLLFKPLTSKKRVEMFKGELQVNYGQHPKTDVLHLVGEVCYPTVKIPEVYDFGSVPPGGYTKTNFILENLSSTSVKYTWRFLEDESEFEHLPELKDTLTTRQTKSNVSISDSNFLEDKYDETISQAKFSITYDQRSHQSIVSQSYNVSLYELPQESPRKGDVRSVISSLLADAEANGSDKFFDGAVPEEAFDPNDWRNIFSVEPWFGVLESHEFCSVNLMFSPPPNVRVKAVLECKCEGGDSERMIVRGLSSTISYKLDKNCVEYEHRLYNEICEDKLTLTNTSYGPITVKILCDPPVAVPKTRWLNVTPTEKQLQPKERVTFNIKYYPGFTGEFRKKFGIVIEYLETIPVYVHGYATFSQVTAQLKRPKMKEYDHVNYKAINDISFSYLKSLEAYNGLLYKHSVKLPTDVPLAEIKWFLMNDWVIMPKNNLYPSTKVIELATERMLLNNFLSGASGARMSTRTGRAADFKLPPYELDFGAVCVGTSVCYTVPLLNNGPIPTDVRLLKDSYAHLERDEFSIELQGGVFEVGETQKLHVVFKPSKKRYGALEEHFVGNGFELRVKNGAIVPINISAIVAWPRIKLERNEVHFGVVGLGLAARRSIVLSNEGYITSRWMTEIVAPNKAFRNNYFVIPDKGKLAPNTTTLLNIYFIPNQQGNITELLYVLVEGSNKRTVVNLIGIGYEPCITIDSSHIKFKTILPHTSVSASLNLENMSQFAVEYCFSDFDKEYEEEKYMIDAYLIYKRLHTVLAPKREVGEKLADIFQGNFHFLMGQVMQRLMETAGNDGKETDVSDMNELSMEEMYNLIKGYVEATHTENDTTRTESLFTLTDYNRNAVSNIGVVEVERSSKTSLDLYQNGLFIVFHGAPFTEYYKMSNKIGKAFALPVYNVDRLIYEELAANECIAAETFNKYMDHIIQSYFPDVVISPEEDAYEFIQRKYETIQTFREIGKGKGSQKSEKSDAKEASFDLPTDLFTCIMEKKLNRFQAGVIVESLDSTILPSTVTVLECLLCACKERYVHLIVLNHTWENYQRISGYSTDGAMYRFSRGGAVSSSAISTDSATKKMKKNVPKRNSVGYDEFIELKKIKKSFDQFETTLQHLLNYCEFWDKQRCMLSTSHLTGSRESHGRVLKPSGTSRRWKSTRSYTLFEYGVPLWIYHSADINNWEEQCSTIIAALKGDPEVKKATSPHYEIPDVESSAEYTVYRHSNKKQRSGCSVFDIVNVSIPREKDTYSSTSRNATKKATKSSLKSHAMGIAKSIQPLQPRIILPCGKKASYRVTFSPKTTGSFKCEYAIELIGFEKAFTIQCEAICQIPQIDFVAEHVFVNVLDNIALKSVHDNFVYVKDKNTFYFGPILIGSAKTPPYKTSFHLRNTSRLPCNITALVDEISMFSCRQPTTVISPGQDMDLEVQVKPVRKHLIQTNLFMTIENNPMVYFVKLQAKPCLIEFNVHPKGLTFGRVPLNTCSTKKLHLNNGCLVDLWWKFACNDWHHKSLKVSPTSGPLKAYTTEDIIVEYKADEEEEIKVELEMLIFDLNCSNTVPFQTETISINANAVCYQAHCSNYIDLGDIKGRTLHNCSFTIHNKGMYSIFVSLQNVDTNDENKLIRKCFELVSVKSMKPYEIPPDNSLTVYFNCEFSKELKITNLPIYLCQLTDVQRAKSPFNTFYIYVSAQVFLSKYEICPPSRLYFGHLEIMYQKVLSLELKNVGKFPFSFHIAGLNSSKEIHSMRNVNSRDSHKGSVLQKDSLKNMKLKSKSEKRLKLSCFTIYPVQGEVQPGKSTFLLIDCRPEDTQEYEEVMTLFVSEPPKECLDGEDIHLHATGAEARLDLTHKRIIFKEHFIVKRIDDFIPPDKIGAHTIYASAEETLYFSRVCINTEKSVNIYLTNISQVNAKISVTLEQQNNFQLSPVLLNIASSNADRLCITFKPTAIGVFKNKLLLSYNRRERNSYELNLVGRSCVPQIKLLGLEPDETNSCEVYLPLGYVKEKQSCRISVQNVGEIPCKVILELRDDQKEYFGMQVCEDSVKYLNMDLPDFKKTKFTTLLNLNTSEVGSFLVTFCAPEEVRCEALLKIHTVNNPFEIYSVKIHGQSYDSEVLVKDLAVTLYERYYLSYKIDFGNIFLSTLYTKRFSLRNSSNEKIFRFEFTSPPPLTIVPQVGHLAPGYVKDIVAAVYSKSIENLQDELLELRYQQISYVHSEDLERHWDDRQDSLFFEQTRDKLKRGSESEMAIEIRDVIKEEERTSLNMISNEPEIIYLEKEYKLIPVLFSLNTNHAIYECDTTDIDFPVTRVDEKATKEFKVRNTGYTPVCIEWSFVDASTENSRGCSASTLCLPRFDRVRVESTKSQRQFAGNSASTLGSRHQSQSDLKLFSSTFVQPTNQPLSIEPKNCIIPAGTDADFTVTFAPVDQATYRYSLRSDVPSLSPLLEPLRISVSARSEFPAFYFELESSDLAYVSKMDGNDSDCKVVQFESVGVGTVCKKSFNLVNHYSDTVAFSFEPRYRTNFSCFACKDVTGTIEPYKKFEVSFRFTPVTLGVFEEKYIFSLINKYFKSTFLLIGTCREAKVAFTTPHITLPNTAVGIESKGKLYLRNDEDMPIAFRFVKDSLISDSGDQKLIVSPASGKLPGKADTVIDIRCEATAVGNYSFVLKCYPDKAHCIMTNVSLTCMKVQSALWYMKEGKKVDIRHSKDNVINVGTIPLNKMTRFKIYISNVGETGFYFSWVYNKKDDEGLGIDVPEGRFVSSYCTTITYVQITPFRRKTINNLKLVLQISHGKTYVLRVNGFAKSTLCKFSFTNYDFQYCVVQKRKTKIYHVDLVLDNLENSSVMAENGFENNNSLTVAFHSIQMAVRSSITIPIYFHPQTVGVYTFYVPIIVDSTTFGIKIRGEAILPNIHLLLANDKYIDMGRIRVDTVQRRVIPVINRSPTVVKVVFNTFENLPSQKVGLDRIESDFAMLKGTDDSSPLKRRKSVRLSEATNEELLKFRNLMRRGSRKSKDTIHSENASMVEKKPLKDFITVLPKEPMEMEINKKYEFTLELCSRERLSSFNETIYYEVNGEVEPLCIIKGSFIAPMFSLDKKFLTFPNVVVGYKCTKSVLLMNKGDINGRYRLSFAEATHIFSASPEEGLLKNNVNRIITITFAPTTLQCQFENKLLCYVDDLPPLELIVSGSSSALPEPMEKLEFSAPVYQTQTKQILITNPTIFAWKVSTKHSNSYWSLLKYVDIAPESCVQIKIDFTPLYSHTEHIKDNLYLEMPDGQVVLYELLGTVLPPLAAGVIFSEVHCKSWHYEVLEVPNKHNVKHCYKVSTELVGATSPRSYYKTSGLELIEVLPNNRKNYMWQVYVINEMPVEFKVTFTTTDTQEYIFFKIILDVLPSLPLDTITLKTVVREQVKGSIQLENPLTIPVTFEISCESPEVVTEKSITLDAASTYRLQVNYCPLESDERVVELEAKSDELGVCLYMLRLFAHPPPLEEKIVFEAELGEKCSNFAEFSNHTGVLLKLTAEFDNPVFFTEKPLVIKSGKTGKFTVTFEPNDVGDFQGIGTLSSPETGSYTYPLLGKCTPPTPKGPFMVKPNESTNITFTNPFVERCTFCFKSLTNYFKLRTESVELDPRTSTNIVVSASGPVTIYPITGKLIVTCDDPSKKDLVWTFYLHSKRFE